MNTYKTIVISVLVLFSTKFIAKDYPKDIFGTRVFVEYKGQLKPSVSLSHIEFIYDHCNDRIFFTNEGLCYEFEKPKKLTHRQRELIEHGHADKVKRKKYYVKMNWLNCNANIQIIPDEKQSYYFSYGSEGDKATVYKKLTYKNVYDNIDIEYFLPDERTGGIKYNVILHPGADITALKIIYSGDVNDIELLDDEVKIKMPLGPITEHKAIAFNANNETISCQYKLEKNSIQFVLGDTYNPSITTTIDPWVTTITTMSTNNYGYDVEYDVNGNLFVYGGNPPYKVAKYNSSGVLQWTFPGVLVSPSFTASQFSTGYVVNRSDGKSYVAGTIGGNAVIRLDQNGIYDNFTSQSAPIEIWDLGYHCPTNGIFVFGGGAGTTNGILNQQTGVYTGAPFTQGFQDAVSHALDDNGNPFMYFSQGVTQGTTGVNNNIARINTILTNTVWQGPSTYSSMGEVINKNNYIGSGLNFLYGPYTLSNNEFNCLDVNGNFLFFYDGFNLAAYNKNTGAMVSSTTIASHTMLEQGGIAVDDCNNIYLGGNTNIRVLNFNGNSFSNVGTIPLNINPAPQYQYIYDIKLNRGTNKLFVCGSGFVGQYDAVYSTACGFSSVNVSCIGTNTGNAVVTISTTILSPTFSYVWTGPGGTVSVTNNTLSNSNGVNGLSNGTYTVYSSINAPCGPVYVSTLTVNCATLCPSSINITQVSCTNSVSTATLVTACPPGNITSIVWNPTPGSVSGNSLNASGLAPGITTVSIFNGTILIGASTVAVNPPPPPVTFTINNLSGTSVLTCSNPIINLAAVSNYTYGSLNYFWSSISFTANTSTVSISQANTITLTVTDPATGCSAQETIAITSNTAVPINSVNPVSQAITCNSGAPVTFSGTVTSPTINIQHDWYSPLNPLPGGVPIATSNNTIAILSGALPPGVYTLVTTNLVNGCSAQKTITITSLSAWPTFSLNSPTNFSVGCNPLHQTTISIVNPVSTQTPPATCSYTFLAPSFTGVVTPSVVLGNNTSTVTTTPGTWTIIVQDNSNFCRTIIQVPIIQNTVAPNVSASMFTQTLTCKNPTVIATGTTTTPNTIITWNVPSTPPTLSTPSVEIGNPSNGPNTSTTSLTYANFTVVATNSLNACQSTSVVTIHQNFKPPISNPTISIATPTAIYCTVGSNPVVLTTGSSTTTSGGGPGAFVANPCWEGPSPQTPTCGPSSYSCYVPGVYSLTVEDAYNGCKHTGTVNVLDKTQPPVITNTLSSAVLDCGNNKADLFIAISGTTTGYRYYFYQYPIGASFSPSNAINLAGVSNASVSVDLTGTYVYIVTNTLTGCVANGSIMVTPGTLIAQFDANPIRGYAPLQVNFLNTSSSSIGTSSINSVWNFGNGTANSFTNNSSVSSIYNSPGTYSVILYTSKGFCKDSAIKIIKVDAPSKLEVPNIFTPNNDGSNDVFFCKTSGIKKIDAIVYDRWGTKVYEVMSSTGNIAWDGKNFAGKECSAGVYMYIIHAEGEDGATYESKGNVTLLR
ncbi:MAG: gliding motility-associated C-terminal domain-containing protein [Sphingobacteriaceae bacterium]|nr:gliding motility-associated C-terminal domain-containing protein [Sphingobacteriaceae bacterium]